MRHSAYLLILLIYIPVLSSCNGSSGKVTDPGLSANQNSRNILQGSTLWGFYDLAVDEDNSTIEILGDRTAEYTANIVTFLNNNPANLGLVINSFENTGTSIEIDMDLSITHPVNLDGFQAYDVRGIFIGDGSGVMGSNDMLMYPVPGKDQSLLNPDGYSRWYNPTEFTNSGLFGYTQGNISDKSYMGSATLNPYKYFADSLGPDDMLDQYFDPGTAEGIFSPGMTNRRNYALSFPIDGPGLKFNYAVIANWNGIKAEKHPSHAKEAQVVTADIAEDLYYVDDTTKGGYLIANLTVFDWFTGSDGSKVDNYNIILESSVLSSPYTLTGEEMNPISSGNGMNTFHISIPADNLQALEGNDLWVLVEYPGTNYSNKFHVPNDLITEPIVAAFNFDVPVMDFVPQPVIEITSPSEAGDYGYGVPLEIEWISTYYHGAVDLFYSTDDFVSDINMIAGFAENSGMFTWNMKPCDLSGEIKIKVAVSTDESIADVTENPINIVDSGWAMSYGDDVEQSGMALATDPDGNSYISGTDAFNAFLTKVSPCGEVAWHVIYGDNFGSGGVTTMGVAVNGLGEIYVTGDFFGTTDFDPAENVVEATSNGGRDVCVSKFDSDGNFLWVRTFGSPELTGFSGDTGWQIATDDFGNVYVGGRFVGTADFDPGPGETLLTSNGDYDCFLVSLDSDGNFNWARTWGGMDYDVSFAVNSDGLGDVYIAGWFTGSVDFKTLGADDIHTAAGSHDDFITRWDSDGNLLWTQTWGGPDPDECHGVFADANGYVYCSGGFMGTSDFDPGPGVDDHSSMGGPDIFVTAYESDGNWRWAKTWGGEMMDMSGMGGICTDSMGSAYVSGMYMGSVDFDPGSGVDMLMPVGGMDSFLTKFDSDGNYQWTQSWGAITDDMCWGIFPDMSDNVYAHGDLQLSADFAPNDNGTCGEYQRELTSQGSTDVYLVKFNSDGCW